MKKLLAVWALLLAAVSANAADKKCPGTVHFLDGRTLECTSITIPGWIDAEVSVRVLSDGKNQARTLAAVEIAYLELWPEKNPEAKNELYCVPFIKEKGKKKIPAARWLVPESSGRHVAFFTRYQTYKMSNKGLVGIVNPKLNVTEPSAYFWKSDEKSPVFLGQYLFFQNSNKKMIALVEGASRQKTPNEIALTILLAGFTLVFVIVCVTLKPFADYSNTVITIASLISLFVCLIPTTIGGLLSAIGIAGMDRALRANVITKSGKAVETAGDIDTLLLDKTGTITIGNRKATHFHTAPGIDLHAFVENCLLSSLSDETPEGKSIVELGRESGIRMRSLNTTGARMIKFTAETKCSGVDLPDGTQIRKGAFDAIRKIVESAGNKFPKEVEEVIAAISSNGGTPLVVCVNQKVTGVIELQDIIKPGIQERFERLRKMGVKTVMVTGDNPLTAKYIAEKAGVDDFIAEAKPEDKMEYIKKEQQSGKLVAMMGDGTNDAPALAQANVGVAMNSGTQAAKEAGNMVDLDNDPTKLIEIVEIGKQLLMTRGTLTTFSIANDVAKYFAIVPALFMVAIPELAALNIMQLHSPESAILSAVIFNAIIIPILIPLALRGVQYKPIGASALLRRNLLIYGVGGVIAPFIGIKLIDLLVGLFF